MGSPFYMRSVVDRNVVMRRKLVLMNWQGMWKKLSWYNYSSVPEFSTRKRVKPLKIYQDNRYGSHIPKRNFPAWQYDVYQSATPNANTGLCTMCLESRCALIKSVRSDVHESLYRPVSILAPLLLCIGRGSFSLGSLYALLQDRYFFLAPTCAMILMRLRSIESEMSINLISLKLDGLPLRSASNTEPVSRNFSVSLRTALRWVTGVSGNC
jgi:hypothetical protein